MVYQAVWFRRTVLGLASAALISLAACGSDGDGSSTPGVIGPDGPGGSATPVPATIENPTMTLAASLSAPDDNGIVTINLSGFPAGTDLPDKAFTVVESSAGGTAAKAAGDEDEGDASEGVVMPTVSVERIGEGTARAGADIAFVFDTTGSMGSALDSVKDSIIGFVDHLDSKGLDVQVGAVTFGDAFDTKLASGGTGGVSLTGNVPPSFDRDERPSFALTSTFGDFKTFISEQRPRNGNDSPENALGALEFAYDTLAWRPGAQRILVVIMDICSHNADTYGEANITAPWVPKTVASVLAKLKGQAIVHVIAPADALEDCGTPYNGAAAYTSMGEFTGLTGTGGVHVDWDGNSDFDLSSLPLTGAVTSGYLVRYVTGVDGKRRVRIVVDDGAEIRGETTVVGE